MSDDFRECKDRAIALADRLRAKYEDVEVVYGIYTPTAPKELWDVRWQSGNEFLHFWVKLTELFLDCSAFQFGEPDYVLTRLDDPRYTMLGTLTAEGGFLNIENSPLKIDWNSLGRTSDGTYTINMEVIPYEGE